MMDDLFADAAAEVVEVAVDAVIGEWKDRDGVAADECRADRPFHQDRRFATPEHGRVPALRQIDDDFVCASFLAVMVNELCTQPARLHADDRVGAWIERLLLAEYLDADHVFLQLVTVTFERLQHDEREKAFQAIALLERWTRQDPFELLADRKVDVSRRNRSRHASGHSSYVTATAGRLGACFQAACRQTVSLVSAISRHDRTDQATINVKAVWKASTEYTRAPATNAPFQRRSSIHPIAGCRIVGPSMLPTLTAPEIVPRNRTGTDSFANAKATTTAPHAKLVAAATATNAASGSGA